MSFPNVVFEVLLREVRFTAEALRARKGRHLLTAVLIWPRPLIAQRTAIREVSIQNGHGDQSQAGWHERVLFKERVQGRFGLVLSLSDTLSDAGMDALLRAVASQTLRQSAGTLTDWAPGSFLAGLWAAPYAVLARDVAGKSEPAPMGTGALDSESGALPRNAPETRVVPLRAPRALTRTLRRGSGGEAPRTLRRTEVPAGGVFGEVVLDIMPAW